MALAAAGAGVVVNDLDIEISGIGSSREPAGDVVREIVQLGGRALAHALPWFSWLSR